MKSLENYNPGVVFLYFLLVAGLVMFASNPVITGISFVAMNAVAFAYTPEGLGRSYLFYFLIFLLTTLTNPVFSHNGVTVLFVVNDNPVTLEAVLYGVMTGFMILSVILLFRVFSSIMTADRLMYVFGRAFPRFGLLVSMALRFIPLFGRQRRKFENTQRTLGLYKNENVIDTVRGKIAILSAMTTWGLENGIITADSMSARGYGIKRRRTSFSMFRFTRSDALFLSFVILSCGFIFFCIATERLKTEFYPQIRLTPATVYPVLCYIVFAALAFFPLAAKKKK